MRKPVKLSAITASTLLIIAFFSACSGLSRSLDVVGKQSIQSFDAVLQAIPDKVTADEMNAGWSLAAPDGSVRFIWSEDYSKSPMYDVMLELDAAPFLNAGLDPEKLPEDYRYYEDKLMIGTKLGDNSFTYKDGSTPLAAYEQIVNQYRDTIGFHTELDHHGVKIGDGNAFEWANDLSSNGTTKENQELDIVFVLNPEPLIAAGVDPGSVKGWAYVPVEMMGETVDKLLKAFNIQ